MYPETPTSRFYGRRKGRPLRASKSQLIQTLLPQISVVISEHGVPEIIFPFTPNSMCLEIGFGGGEHLAAIAEANPTGGFIGCEPFLNGIASLCQHIHKRGLENIRIFPDDARHVLNALPAESIDRCYILYADPWRKSRHTDRRFVGPENIPRLARVLKSGSELHLATDDAQLAEWMRQHLTLAPEFQCVMDSFTPPVDWVSTRYEQKALKAGRKPHYMIWRRL
jgi:tRNA (guanine-N7-)-methyltransferase